MPYSNINIITQNNLSFVTGQYIQVIHNSSNYIVGQVVDYNSTPGLLVFTPITVVGSGTYTSWTIICSSSPGEQGTSGTSGTSGVNGTSGSSGTSGLNGTSGVSGTSGTSGVSGTSGTSGIDGTSGVSGTSGTSGVDGASGTSGVSGTSGTSGVDGTSGTSGTSGATGTSGAAGTSGTSGTSGSTPNPNARTETTFTATAGQTTFTVSYTVGQVDVYYNGSKLAPAEFTATTGTSIVLATACQENDIVDVLANITGGGVGGGGTTDYVPRFTGSTTLGNSSLQQVSTGWMQLGDSSVNTSVFEIQGNNGVQLGLYDGYAYNTIQTQNAYAFTILNQIGATSTSLMDYNYITKTLTFQTNGNNTRLNITSSGNVGIGNTNNTYKLDVTGTGRFTGTITAGAANGNIRLSGATTDAFIGVNTSTMYLTDWNTAAIGMVINLSTGNVGIGTSSPTALGTGYTTLDVRGSSGGGINMGNATYSGYIYCDTEFRLQSSNSAITFLPSGSEKMRITSTGNVGIGTSYPSQPLHVYATSTTTSSYFETSSANSYIGLKSTSGVCYIGNVNYAMTFEAGGSERMRITTSGNLGVGAIPASNTRIRVRGADQSSSGYTLICDNAVTDTFYIRNDGYINVGTAASSPYNNTYGNAANAFLSSDGSLGRSTSSLKYKKNVENYTKGLNEVMQLRPVSYQSKNTKEDGITFAGLIAEEVHELGLTEFVQYAEDGTPDALAYQNMVALLVKAVQEQQIQIEELKAKIK